MYIAHGPISYLANEAIQSKKIKRLKMSDQILVALCALFFGILPDFDIFILSMLNVPRFIHHEVITHTPVFYIGIWIILQGLIYIKEKLLNEKTNKALDNNLSHILANTFLISTLFHLFADFLVDSIMLAYPLSEQKFHLLKYIFEPNLFAGFPFSVMGSIEIFFIALFIFALYKKFIKRNKVVDISLKALILITALYIPFTMWVPAWRGQTPIFDSDYDTIADGQDPDVGNTKEDNLEKVNADKLLKEAEEIMASGKWTNQDPNSFIKGIKNAFGGFGSYRIISQTHYNLRLPIEPVLRDYYVKKYGFKSYFFSDYEYPTLLFEYLQEKEMLEEVKMEEDISIIPGKVFFLVDPEEELNIINLGITLKEKHLATVFAKDDYLTEHTYEEVKEIYNENFVFYIQK
jgi:hypothetical protein